jgi:hypothetical protein
VDRNSDTRAEHLNTKLLDRHFMVQAASTTIAAWADQPQQADATESNSVGYGVGVPYHVEIKLLGQPTASSMTPVTIGSSPRKLPRLCLHPDDLSSTRRYFASGELSMRGSRAS